MKKATFRLVVAVCLSISFLYSSAQHQDATWYRIGCLQCKWAENNFLKANALI